MNVGGCLESRFIRVAGTRGVTFRNQRHTTMPPQQSTQTNELDELFEVLSRPHRRRILTRLNALNPRDEDEFELEGLAGDELADKSISLIHIHLPKLADSEFINWDRERQIVTRGPRFHEIAPLIDLMVTHQDELPENWP